MPNRILREGILTSPKMAALNWAEEVFYRRLHSVVDDFGRYFAEPGLLRAACYPRQLNKVSDSDIEKWLQATEKAALVRVYPAQDGERYLEVVEFRQQVRAKKSKFPDAMSECVADAAHAHCDGTASAHLGVSVSVSVSEDGGDTRAGAPPPSTSKKGRKTAMASGFGVGDRVQAWAREKGFGQLQEHLEAFRRKVEAKGYTYVDWDAAFMEAIREDWAKLRGRAPNGAAPPPDVLAPRGPDPALLKLAEDDRRAAPMPAAVRNKAAAILGRKVPHETSEAARAT